MVDISLRRYAEIFLWLILVSISVILSFAAGKISIYRHMSMKDLIRKKIEDG